jgi:RNA polymerase sigma-70 factor (ECF subfamily)
LGLLGHLVGMVMELGLPLVRAAAAGDTEAFTRIVAAYNRDMTRVAFTIVGDGDLAADAVQSAWAIAWRQLGRHREDASLRSWLLKIAANEARQIARRSQRRTVREVPVDEGLTGLVDTTRGADIPSQIDLSRALARLSVDDRTLLALRYGADMDSSDIARLLGGTASGVRTRLARLLHRLREDLDHA